MLIRRAKFVAGPVCLCAAIAFGGALDDSATAAAVGSVLAPSSSARTVTGIALPRRSFTLGPVQPGGRIASIPVAEGQVVKAGDILFALDDRVQSARTKIAEKQAESTLDVELTGVRLAWARQEASRLSRLGADSQASDREVRDARLGADTAKLEQAKAKFEHEQAGLRLALERCRLKELTVRAPFSGYVTGLLKQVGETIDERDGIVTMVELDPLNVLLNCPLRLAGSVNVGDKVAVKPTDARWPPRTGEVTFASRAADPASQTFQVRIRVPNKDGGWISGFKVTVSFGSDAE